MPLALRTVAVKEGVVPLLHNELPQAEVAGVPDRDVVRVRLLVVQSFRRHSFRGITVKQTNRLAV